MKFHVDDYAQIVGNSTILPHYFPKGKIVKLLRHSTYLNRSAWEVEGKIERFKNTAKIFSTNIKHIRTKLLSQKSKELTLKDVSAKLDKVLYNQSVVNVQIDKIIKWINTHKK